MSEEELEPVDHEMSKLFAGERARLSTPAGAQQRVAARVRATLGGGGGGHGGSDAHRIRHLRLGSLALSFVLGGAVGAALMHRFEARERLLVSSSVASAPPLAASAPTPTAPALMPVPPPSSGAPTNDAPPLAAGDQPRVPPTMTARDPALAPVRPAPVTSERVTSAGLAPGVQGERMLLDDARRAFASGDYAFALDRLAAHARSHPNGLLVEEREALAVRALRASGASAAAEQRGRRFLVRYPGSLFGGAVRAAMEDDGGEP